MVIVLNTVPLSNSSTLSPNTTGALVGRVTRKVVVVNSAAFIWLSPKWLLPLSASVAVPGARVSSVKLTGALAGLTLPTASVILAVRFLGPSAPSWTRVTVKST